MYLICSCLSFNRYVDYFIIPSHNLTDYSENGVTYHPSRLMGLADILNTVTEICTTLLHIHITLEIWLHIHENIIIRKFNIITRLLFHIFDNFPYLLPLKIDQ